MITKITKYFSHPIFAPISGTLILFFSFLPLQLWLYIFMVTMSEFPINGIGMDLSNYCRLQINLSDYFSGLPQKSFLPLLIIFHGSAFLFVFRSRKKDQLPMLPLEFGVLNFLFLPLGTTLFIFGLCVEIIVSVVTGSSPGSDNNFLFTCKTTGGFWPGLIATILATAGLFYSQATGWLGRLIIRLSPQMRKYCLIVLLILSGGCSLLTWPILFPIM